MNTYRKKIEQYGRKNLGHVSGYVSRERGATIYPPNKNFVIEILIRKEMNMETRINKTRGGGQVKSYHSRLE